MVYLNLSVECVETAVEFYSVSLGAFDVQLGTRLICNVGADLIIDLHEVGTERHKEIFMQDSHVASSFWVSLKDNIAELDFINNLQKHGVEYLETANLGGHLISFKDPSSNSFSIHANLGVIQ